MSEAAARHAPRLQRMGVRILHAIERLIFFVIGLMLFAAAIALLMRAGLVLWALFASPPGYEMTAGAAFLDIVLLVLMVVELAYTVVLSLQGVVLSAEPFLIVGLIAVIRRVLVITVGEFHGGGTASELTPHSSLDLAILTGVILVFVVSITLLRSRKPNEDHSIITDHH